MTGNQNISGRVTLPNAATTSRVVVYVHTDKWYVHPYIGQGDGLGWAHINPDGTWTIRTVKREFAADLVGAFVIGRAGPILNIMADWGSELQPSASCVVNLTDANGKKWYGRL